MSVCKKTLRKGRVPSPEYKDMTFSEESGEGNLYNLTEFFKILGNPTHIRILLMLAEHDTCINEITKRLGYTQSAISHQLSLLKSNKMVKQHRDGKRVFYTLADEYIRQVIEKGKEYTLYR